MSTEKTSRAARHLRLVHHLHSPNTDVEVAGKRKSNAEGEMLCASLLDASNPARLNLLLETFGSYLPLRTGKYMESKLLEALVVKQEMQTVVNAKRVKEAIVELYRLTKAEMLEYLADNREHYPLFTLVADPFKTWLTKMLKDFGLSTNDFYGFASDSGDDVKSMLSSELHLRWE
ncbi:unnamed protein product [Phytophthora fragariaefolia]|uniref:Unnamed protein product n=1 Tax=Phytophthora fragariaefolia TaxID=1490495 RepID=A0A9W6Y5R6_9STRA|nr:unnamed protein product [Phytophthora fragariaefolia]